MIIKNKNRLRTRYSSVIEGFSQKGPFEILYETCDLNFKDLK